MASLLSDFLNALGVRHTESYSDKRFSEMPFKSMFGLSSLLKEYGVGSVGVRVPEGSRVDALGKFRVPFLVDTPDGFAIVTKVADGSVTYLSQHYEFTAPVGKVVDSWNGIAMLAATDKDSVEPQYEVHHLAEIAENVKKWLLCFLAVALFGFAMWSTGLYAHWAAWLVAALDCTGIWFSWMLVQKSLGIHTETANAVCSVLQEGGCDEIARSEASSFLGIFKWSEVGLAYFSVSLLALLLVPSVLPALAAINILCLPYSFWSIWYQKFKAKTWCTLCVCVQANLWLLFFAYLSGGVTRQVLAFTPEFWIEFFVLGAVYVAAMLGLNRLDTALSKYIKTDNNESASNS